VSKGEPQNATEQRRGKHAHMTIGGLVVATLTAASLPGLACEKNETRQYLTRNFRYVCPTAPEGSYTQLWSQLQQ
jgi:hypothetical protein